MPVLTLLSPVSYWLLLGILLVVSEFVVPGFVICFFGVAAILVAGLYALFPSLAFSWAILIYIVLSLALVFASRRFLPKTFRGRTDVEKGDPDDDGVRGERVRVAEAIAPDVPGKVEFRGSLWIAAAEEAVPAGAVVEIERRDNLTLHVRKLP